MLFLSGSAMFHCLFITRQGVFITPPSITIASAAIATRFWHKMKILILKQVLWHHFLMYRCKHFFMAINLLETVVKNLGYNPLHKVDPNEQEVKALDSLSKDEKLYQAAVPAALTAFSLFAVTGKGYEKIMHSALKEQHPDIFGGKQQEIAEKIAQYSGATTEEAKATMGRVVQEAMRIVQDEKDKGASMDTIKNTLDDHRQTILQYLPASLQLGDLLDDSSMDDRTHKMQGPMSNLAHMFEKKLPGGEKPPEKKA